jgi:methyl-accepting chemotaxis protein
MSHTEPTITDLKSLVTELSRQSKKITGIINMIDDLADKANLLALDTAVDSARNEQQDEQFSSISRNVENLASETGRAAQEAGRMIQELQRTVCSLSNSVSDVETELSTDT